MLGQRGEQYSMKLWMTLRCAKEGLCMVEDAHSAAAFDGQFRNVVCPVKIIADGEVQRFE